MLWLAEFAAVISRLPAAAYAAAAVEARLQELAWVAERGVAHERVVAWFVDHADVVPAPLLTLYSGEAALRQTAAERSAVVSAQLDRLAGRREWDLKISCDRARLERHAGSISRELRALDTEIAAAPPGRRFLLERKRAAAFKRELDAAARNLAESYLEQLRPCATAVVVLAPPRTGQDLPVLLAAALLVEREREPELQQLAAQHAVSPSSLGFTIDLTGPWAPYRFLDVERVQPA